jgi:hypothetical protein
LTSDDYGRHCCFEQRVAAKLVPNSMIDAGEEHAMRPLLYDPVEPLNLSNEQLID